MIRRAATILFLFSIVISPLAAQTFSARLTADAEVPGPGEPGGTGVAVITIDGSTVRYTILTHGIGTANAAHIHTGAAGVAGPPVVTFDVNTLLGGSVAGVSQSLIDDIVANPGNFYVNVHTAAYPAGAVRGQLVASAATGSGMSFLPVVGKVRGANNTNYVTDLRILNSTDTQASVVLDYFAMSEAGHSAPTATETVTVAAGEQIVLDDFVGSLAVAGGLGALRITSDQDVIVVSRVINDLRSEGQGTTGFASSAATVPATAGSIPFLISNEHFRTNVGYFNASSTAVMATFTARRSSDGAVLGTRTLTIPAGSMVQQGVFGLVPVPEAIQVQDNYYLSWAADGPLFVYGSVVDNVTGDSVLLQ